MRRDDSFRLAMLAPVAWRTPPRHYGPWERVTSLLTEELVARGIDVTLFATGDSLTAGSLRSVCAKGYEEDRDVDAKALEALHIASLFEAAEEFDLIHNHFDFLPLTYSRLVATPMITTIHGFSSPKIVPVYKAYDDHVAYISISDADRSDELTYLATIHHGIDIERFTYRETPGSYLLFFGRFHHDKGAADAVGIALATGLPLIMAGIIQDRDYFAEHVEPYLADGSIRYVGSVGPDERDELLGNALTLLHPIHFDEPFGLSVVEAMACGTPVIAYDRGSMPELIEEGGNGLLVRNVEEAVEAVGRIASIDRRRCRETVERRFTARRMADEYIRAYSRLLDRDDLLRFLSPDSRHAEGA